MLPWPAGSHHYIRGKIENRLHGHTTMSFDYKVLGVKLYLATYFSLETCILYDVSQKKGSKRGCFGGHAVHCVIIQPHLHFK